MVISNSDVKAPTSADVVIVGAGLSGLVAAHQLEQQGYRILLLEAQSRIGGRINTVHTSFGSGQYYEAGASRIPSIHHLTINYIRDLGLKLSNCHPTHGKYSNLFNGHQFSEDEWGSGHTNLVGKTPDLPEIVLNHKRVASDLLAPILDKLGVLDQPHNLHEAAKKYDKKSFSDFLRGIGADESTIRGLFFYRYERYLKDHASALFLLRNIALLKGMTGYYTIDGGCDQLPNRLLTKIKGRVLKHAAVIEINQNHRGATIHFSHRGLPTIVNSQKVIVTVPPRVMARINFQPGLSPQKKLINDAWMPFDPCAIALEFKEPFWEDLGFNGCGRGDLPFEVCPVNTHSSKNILRFGIRNPIFSARLERMSPKARRTALCQQLESLFPGSKNLEQLVLAQHGVFWARDPWSRGGHGVMPVGCLVPGIQHCAKPEDLVHFAGSHTSPYSSWMQGAIESGLRVAQEIKSGTLNSAMKDCDLSQLTTS